MDRTQTPGLADVVLFLGHFTGVEDIVSLSDNKRYQFIPPTTGTRWKGDKPREKLTGAILCLTFGEHLFSPEGWVMGSSPDSDVCDLQLAKNNQTGISRRHFRIDTAPKTRLPRLTVLSATGTIRLLDGGRSVSLVRGKSIEISRMVTIDLGAVSFRAWRPELTVAEERRYNEKALNWSKEVVAAVPRYFPPLNSQPETVTSNIRYGKNKAVYVNEGGVEARGMTASVMCVRERKSGSMFGAKEPYFKASDDFGKVRSRWEDLRREFDNVVKLDHPHIVKAIELVMAEDEKNPPWLIMEYIPQSLSPKDLDQKAIPIILTHVSSALAYMHANRITHRDVKPDNILLQDSEPLVAKLADFGTARHNIREYMDTFAGTRIYMAPEFFERPLQYTNKVDLFSLGLVALQCLTKWDPQSDEAWASGSLDRRGHEQWMRDVIIPCVADAPSVFQAWLTGMLRKRPKQRWPADKALSYLWQTRDGLEQHGPRLEDDVIERGPSEETHAQKRERIAPNSKKRPASTLSENSSGLRHGRDRPSRLSPADLQGKSASPQPEGSPFVMPSSPYSVPTPHDQKEGSDEPDEPDESAYEDDADLEDDWRESHDEPEDFA